MFGDRLTYLREKEGLTKKELADKLGISPSAIGHYESGRREPALEILKVFANYFGVSLDYLLGNDNTKKVETAISLRDEIIKIMIQRGIIEDVTKLNNEHLKLIEMAINTYKSEK